MLETGRQTWGWFVAALATCLALSTAPVQAGIGLAGAEPTRTLTPPGLEDDARFGTAVDVDAGTLVVGAPGDGPQGNGVAYVYQRATSGGWSFPQPIEAPGGADSFGASVAVSASTVVVGAPLSDAGAGYAGAVYVYIPGAFGWEQQAKLTLPSPETGAHLGRSVSIDGTTIAAGAPLEDRSGVTNAGAAYVAERSGVGWSPLSPLATPPAERTAEFGHSVAVDGSNLLVGAPRVDVDADRDGSLEVNAGAAYAYAGSGTTWAGPVRFTASDGGDGDHFGRPVALDGSTAVVGARDADVDGHLEAGAAYVLDGSTGWVEEARLEAETPQQEASFGHAVAVDGNTVLVGSPHYDGDRPSTGRAHVYARGPGGAWDVVDTSEPGEAEVWDETDQGEHRSPADYDRFGQSVALAGADAVVGAPFDEVEDTGSARVFDVP